VKRAGLLLAIMLVIVANLIALARARHNRAIIPKVDHVMTERELLLVSSKEDDSGIALRLVWQSLDPDGPDEDPWLDRSKLEDLGFDIPPAGHDHEFYDWRQVLVVLELDEEREEGSRLIAIDAGLDREELARAYGSSPRYIMAPGVVRMRLRPHAGHPTEATGRVQRLLPGVIHVPKAHAGYLSSLGERSEDAEPPRYAVTLRYGRRLEPWVVKVEPLSPE
jgi:hypothetical protein